MNYLSVCSGVEAATVAWHHIGWKPVGFSEIEKFPSEVLAHHYPTVTNFGDMTKYKEWKLDDPIGLLVGGTPCQSFSVAGLRKGLNDPRGNLALTYIGILDRFRPKWCVWENVPGVLSSGGGRDFGSFLGALGELGYGWAYRVLDAQNFGVAQRRRRVFVVGCLGDWRPPAEVLFESDCLRGDIKESGSEKQAAADGFVPRIASCLQTTCNDYSRADNFNMIAFESSRRDGVRLYGDKTNTLQAFAGTGGGNGPCIALAENTIGRQPQNGGNGDGFTENGPMYTLNATGIHGIATYDMKQHHNPQASTNIQLTTANCSTVRGDTPLVRQSMSVRRLTPVECERLQGFPDNYTNIKENCPDGPRYKAMGNSMAVPVMRWIGERINMVNNEQ
jgi:DNA (cytosine-5)-methyltransferase 1